MYIYIDIEIDKDKDFNTVEVYFRHVVHLSFFWLSFRSRRVAIFFSFDECVPLYFRNSHVSLSIVLLDL